MNKWIRHGPLILELFIVANLSFLVVDIFVAHSTNAFSHPAEWIPFYFSIGAPVLLVLESGLNLREKSPRRRLLGFFVGYASSIIGIAGMLWHLHGSFFEYQTLKSLVYTAPFAAPLAYTGLGCLLIMNRMIEPDEMEWSQWLIFFALGGFFGNFVLALCDHAQNGFFLITEWIPVISSAVAVSFLGIPLLRKCSCRFVDICLIIMGVQVIVGILGFYFHGIAVTRGSSSSFFENLVYTAPIFAPLLFANLAILAGIGLLGVRYHLAARETLAS